MTSKSSCRSILRLCKQLKPEEPTPRWGHLSWLDSNQFLLYVAGGYNDVEGYLSDLWVYDIRFKTWELLQRDQIWIRCHAVTLHLSFANVVVIFGGLPPSQDRQKFLSLLKVSPAEIQSIAGLDIPTRRCHAGAIFNFMHLVYHGGFIQEEEKLSSSFQIVDFRKEKAVQFKFKNMRSTELLSNSARQFHSLVASSNHLYIIGGCNENSTLIAQQILIIRCSWSLEISNVSTYKPNTQRIPRWGHGAVYEPYLNCILLFGGFSLHLDDSLMASISIQEEREHRIGEIDIGRQGTHAYQHGVLFSFGGFFENEFTNSMCMRLLPIYESFFEDELKRKAERYLSKINSDSNPTLITQIYTLGLSSVNYRKRTLKFANGEESEEDMLVLIERFTYFSTILHFTARHQKRLPSDIDLTNIEKDTFQKLLYISSDSFIADSFLDQFNFLPSIIEAAYFLCAPKQLHTVSDLSFQQRLLWLVLYIVAKKSTEQVLRVFLEFSEGHSSVQKKILLVSYLNWKKSTEEWVRMGEELGEGDKFSRISNQLRLYKYLM